MKKLEKRNAKYIEDLLSRYKNLQICKDSIINAYFLMEECYENNRKLLVAGNGGSAADSEHIVGELMKRFQIPRPVNSEYAMLLKEADPDRGNWLAKNLEETLTAIPLVGHEALATAYANDVDGIGVYAQQLYGYGKQGDVFIAITTSGNSENILNASVVAKASGIKIIGLTGEKGGELEQIADVIVKVPENETYLIQELHLPIYHCWCHMLEEHFFGRTFLDRGM